MKKYGSLIISGLITCLALSIAYGLTEQNNNPYNIANIPKDLNINSDAVVRINSTLFEVRDHKSAHMKVKYAVTIFNRESRHLGELALPYDKFSKIEELKGTLFAGDGKKLRELRDNDIEDFSNISRYSLYEDSRVITAALYHDQYPYSVEFLYEISYDGYLLWPTWFAQENKNAVEYSQFEVILPSNQNLRFWCNKDSVKPDIKLEEEKKRYIWHESCLTKIQITSNDDIEDLTTIVRIAPTSFEIDGFAGSFNSWKDFGLWYYGLIKDRNNLSLSIEKDIQSLIDTTDAAYSKIKKIYQYMQSRTRYVSIQLGLGGWQPFDAVYVLENAYGDCKALANYLVTLLETVNIKAYPVLIKSGYYRYPMITEFPSDQFNHVIVCVPMESDSIWLECTNNSIPIGHIGAKNEDRSALMVTPEGGYIVRTPSSSAEKNIKKREASVVLSSNGDAEISTKTLLLGNQQDYFRNILYEASSDDKEKWLLNTLKLPKVNIKNFKINGISERKSELSLFIDFSTSRFMSLSGSRLFFQPNLMERRTTVPAPEAIRLSPFRLSYAYLDIDSIYYRIPKGYKPEALPQRVEKKTQFGFFSSQSNSFGDTAVVYKRILKIWQKKISTDLYKDYCDFITDVVKSDRAQVVLIKK